MRQNMSMSAREGAFFCRSERHSLTRLIPETFRPNYREGKRHARLLLSLYSHYSSSSFHYWTCTPPNAHSVKLFTLRMMTWHLSSFCFSSLQFLELSVVLCFLLSSLALQPGMYGNFPRSGARCRCAFFVSQVSF